MAYYDRWVSDPAASSAELASRLNISPEGLQARLDRISEAAQSGVHLTLGQARLFLADPEQSPDDLRAHLDSCPYCQAMVDGLQPDRLRANFERLNDELKSAVEDSSFQPALLIFQNFQAGLQRFAIPVAAFAVLGVFASVALSFQLRSTRSSLTDLRAQNFELARVREPAAAKFVYNTSMSDDERALMARNNFELSTRLLEARQFVHASSELSDEERKKFYEILSSGHDAGFGSGATSPSLRFANPVSVSLNDPGAAGRSREELELGFERNKEALYALYAKALRNNPRLEGEVVFNVTVAPSGEVVDCQVGSTTLNDANLERALVARIRLIRFFAKDVGTVTFQKTVSFSPG